MLDRTTDLPVGDSRKRDPTGTSGIRTAFRRSGKLRLRQLRAALRVAVVDHDLLGLSQDSIMRYHAASTRLAAFSGFLESEASRLLCSEWFVPHVQRAWQSGVQTAQREVNSLMPLLGPDKLLELTRREISGIVAALVQQVTRAASKLLTRRGHKVRAWRTLLLPFDKVGELRVVLLADTMTVTAHNEAKLEVYREAGVRQVGVNPEWLPARKVRDAFDAYDPKLKVGVRTAEDDRVCFECQDYAAGAPYDRDEVEGTLPLHPRCRCSWYPWLDKRFKHDGNEAGDGESQQR